MILVKEWKKYLEELVNPETIDVSSFEVHDNLSPEVWGGEDILEPEIADRLYEIAQDFFKSLDLEWVKIHDIIITGSLAAYNWSKYSDIDLHILIDYNEVDENQELVKDYLKSERMRWNRTHDIRIKGYEVEIYVQDVNEEHHAHGIYSIVKEEWIKKPERENVDVDWSNVQKKAASLMDRIDDVYELFDNEEYVEAEKAALKMKDKIRRLRMSGLEKTGIYSVENLAFKVLRRNDYLQKLSSLRILSYDKKMSLKDE